MKLSINKNKNTITYCSIAVFLMLFYCYNYTMADILYGNKVVIVVSFAISVALCLIPIIKGQKLTIDVYTLLWCGCLFLAVYNNRRIQSGDFAPKMLCWFAMVICILILKNSINWIPTLITIMYIFSIIHMFFAWFFRIFPNLFYRFSNLFSGVNKATMISHFNKGYLLGITTHYSTLAIYLGNGLVIMTALFLLEKNVRKKRKLLFTIILLGITLSMIGKRGMLVFVAISIILFALIVKVKNFSKFFPIFIKYLILLLLIVFIFVLLANTILPQLSITLNRFIHTTEGADFSNGRGRMWQLAIQIFKDSPVLGIGWFGYREYYSIAWYHGSIFQMLDTHNVYLQLLCETGLIGFILFVGTMYSTLFMSIKDFRKCIYGSIKYNELYKNALAVSVIVQILFLLYCMTGNPLYDPQNFIVYFLVITIEYSLHSKLKENV